MMILRSALPEPPAWRPTTRTGNRKVALCGSHSASLADAPWHDPSWEFWGHASARGWYARAMDRYFDLHPKACWTRAGKGEKNYTQWLAQNTTPIFMQKHFKEAPASVEYPKGRILLEFADARGYFTNHTAWMIALALTEGVQTIGLFGINYSTESEYVRQRGSAEYWIGRASGAGVRVILPEQCTLLREPSLLYGYDSHDETTGLIKDEYKRKEWKAAETIRPCEPGKRAEAPEKIRVLIEQEQKEFPPPEWALGPLVEDGVRLND